MEMDEAQKKLAKQWVENWKRVGPILERERLLNLGKRPIAETIELFDGFFKHALLRNVPSVTSGLVEMQSYLRKIKR